MVKTTFEQQLAFGKIGESKIAEWFKRKNYYVLPIYEKEVSEGKGPQVFGLDENLIAPDMLVFNRQKIFWIEAKHKSVFSWHRTTSQWVTGIDLKYYNDYLKITALSPWPVWLLFLHEKGYTDEWPHNCPTGLFGGELTTLSKLENHRSDKWGKSGMVYWGVDSLTKIK